MSAKDDKRVPRTAVIALLGLLAVSAFMYVSIMYKIIKFGP